MASDRRGVGPGVGVQDVKWRLTDGALGQASTDVQNWTPRDVSRNVTSDDVSGVLVLRDMLVQQCHTVSNGVRWRVVHQDWSH